MKNVCMIYYMINYVICDTCFAIEMGFRRLLPPYQLYKISEWLNYAKGIRVLGRFYWWFDTEGGQKRYMRESRIDDYNAVESPSLIYGLYIAPSLFFLNLFVNKKYNFENSFLWIFIIPSLLLSILQISFHSYKKRDIRFLKIFNRLRKKYIWKWRIEALAILVTDWLVSYLIFGLF